MINFSDKRHKSTRLIYRYTSPVTHYFLESGIDMGYDLTDVNGEKQTGFTRSQATLREGLRCSTARGYLSINRPNLHIATRSHVLHIDIDPATKAASGVIFRRKGRKRLVKANIEVILSAGAIQSPQLLMLSGIGPQNDLRNLGINVIHNLPGVGQNMQDHVAVGGLTFLVDKPAHMFSNTGFTCRTDDYLHIEHTMEFFKRHSGRLYSAPFCEAMAFINTRLEILMKHWVKFRNENFVHRILEE